MSAEPQLVRVVQNPNARAGQERPSMTAMFSPVQAARAREFHASFPGYSPTPLQDLASLAQGLGLSKIWIKDESKRFGLNAFKVLGGSFAIASLIQKRLGLAELSHRLFCSREIRARVKDITLATTTDGNHGRGVAWTARQLGCRAVVNMPKGTKQARFDAIRGLGADVTVTHMNYDDTVQMTAQKALANGWTLVQDTAWPGYEEVPVLIMQGYLTILHEAFEQMSGHTPTHVFAQCGVGSLAACLQAYLIERLGPDRPMFVVVEPHQAACCFESMGKGQRTRVQGDLDTIMAGLACGEPSTKAWDILLNYSDAFVSCDDEITRKGMRLLANPSASDPKIISGESGAVTAGLVAHAMQDDGRLGLEMKLDQNSKVLLISTEGATDPEMYGKIVGSG